MRAHLLIDDAVGERRRALLDADGRAFRLEIGRWSERGKLARLDEVWWGRVTARMPGQRGWFVDLGLERAGVIEPTRSARVTEGAMLALRVKSEAWSDKGPVLSLADMSPTVVAPPVPGLHAAAEEDAFLRGVEIADVREGIAARRLIDDALEEAETRVVPLPGGGDISIETTRGLTAIDVDAGPRIAEQDAAGFATHLNLAAAREAARQLALRGLGGLCAIDFVRMDGRRDQREVVEAFRQSLKAFLGRASEVLELSPLGICEAAIARRSRPVREALAALEPERQALDTIRELETAGLADRGARLRARVSQAVHDWLEADPIGWRAALADRIGQRWLLEIGGDAGGLPDIGRIE